MIVIILKENNFYKFKFKISFLNYLVLASSIQEFQKIYKQFFPFGDPTKFASFVFKVFDDNKVSCVSRVGQYCDFSHNVNVLYVLEFLQTNVSRKTFQYQDKKCFFRLCFLFLLENKQQQKRKIKKFNLYF